MALQRCCSSLPFRDSVVIQPPIASVWDFTLTMWKLQKLLSLNVHWDRPSVTLANTRPLYRASARIARKEMNKFGIRFLSRMKILNYLFKTSAWQLARKSFQSPKACISSHPSHPEHTPVNTPVKIAHIVFFALSLLIFWSSLPHLPLIAALLSRPFNAISSSDLPFLFCRHSLDLRSKIRARFAFWHEKFG